MTPAERASAMVNHGAQGEDEATLLNFLRMQLPTLCPPTLLGVPCVSLGIELWRVAPAHLPHEQRIEQLLAHLQDNNRLQAFAHALLLEDATASVAIEHGLPVLLGEPTALGSISGPEVCHPLPSTATWVGRAAELGALDRHWQAGGRVISVTGPMGMGKSALLSRWLTDRGLLEPANFSTAGICGAFYWSFTHDPDVTAFMLAAAHYAIGAGGQQPLTLTAPLGRSGCDQAIAERARLQLLSALRRRSLPLLLVLDGLERLQVGGAMPSPLSVAVSDTWAALSPATDPGELGDPNLSALLRELAVPGSPAVVVCTLERTVPSLQAWRPVGYAQIELAPLLGGDGVHLLRMLGANRGTDSDGEQRATELSGHALSVELLGRYLTAYYQGDSRAVTYAELPSEGPSGEVSTHLARMVRAHLQALGEQYRRLLDLCALVPGPLPLAALESLLRVAESDRPSHDAATPPVMPTPGAFAPPIQLSNLFPAAPWCKPSILDRLQDLERLGLLQLLTTASGERVIVLHPLLRTQLLTEWLATAGGHIPRQDVAGAEQSDSPGGDVPVLPQGEGAIDLLEQLLGMLLRAGHPDVAFAVLSHRLGGFVHMVLHLGRPRRLLGLLRRLYPALAALALRDPRWQRRYAHLLAWEAEALRILGQLEAALVTAQRQWPIGSGPLPGSWARQARIHRLAGRLQQAEQTAHLALLLATSDAEQVIGALEMAALLLLKGDPALCQVYLRQVELQLHNQPWLRAMRWDGLSLGAWLQREQARHALRIGAQARARTLIESSRQSAEREHSEVDLAQCDVLLGEALRREGLHEPAAHSLHRALQFASRSGDAEVLVSGGLGQARQRLELGHYEAAASSLGTALAMAVEIGLGCYRIELLLLRGGMHLRRNDLVAAENDARDALAMASAPGCGYQWGEADALHLISTILLVTRPARGSAPHQEAIAHLTDELALREAMHDPTVQEIRWLLRRLKT